MDVQQNFSSDLDAADRRMLAVLQEQGRISNQDLAVAAHLSAAQCSRRLRRLEDLGWIKRYEARLNADQLGFGVVAFIRVTMERGHSRQIDAFKQMVRDMPEVQECYAVTGDADYVLKVVATDLKSLSGLLIGQLMNLPGVHAVHSTVCLDEIKCSSALPLAK